MTQRSSVDLNVELVNLNKRPAQRAGQAAIRPKSENREYGRNTGNYRTAMGSRSGTGSQSGGSSRTAVDSRPAAGSRNANGRNAAGSPTTAAGRRVQAKRKKRRQRLLRNIACGVIAVNLTIVFIYMFFFYQKGGAETTVKSGGKLTENGAAGPAGLAVHPDWTEDFLTVSEYSRPGTALRTVSNIFVHYTANPGTSAAQNRSYFEQLKDTHERSASAHFIIGYEGEIIQCIPLDEMAYAVKTRNEDSISIECCYKDKDGSFTDETYQSLIKLLAWLVKTYGLEADDILRHYDCGGKKCPLYYVDNEKDWTKLKQDVKDSI